MIKNPIKTLFPNDNKFHGIYRGVIEDRNDPKKLGRCKIRVFGIHDFKNDKDIIEGVLTEELPWAEPAMGLIEGSISGFGLWSVPLQGTHVFLFFENSNMMQPRFFASAPGKPLQLPDTSKGFNDPNGEYPNKIDESDVNRLARVEKINETLVQHKNNELDKNVNVAVGEPWDEPESFYEAKYPDNIVLATHAGITVELDTTQGKERLHIYHPSNTYIEIDNEGKMVIRNANDRFDIIDSNEYKHVKIDRRLTVGGDEIDLVEGNMTSNIGIDKNIIIGANKNKNVIGDEVISIGNNRKTTIGGNETVNIVGSQTITASSRNVNISGNGTTEMTGNQTTTINGNSRLTASTIYLN